MREPTPFDKLFPNRAARIGIYFAWYPLKLATFIATKLAERRESRISE